MKSPIERYLEELHQTFSKEKSGTVASYIPELFKANPEWFGICLVTTDGHVYEVGDTRQNFTIQSISKALVYGMALEDNGRAEVLRKVGVEPTGDAFNSISLHPQTGQPANPMINAGAIATTGLVEGKTSRQKINRILNAMSRYVGRSLGIDQEVYRSESETGHRNRAIAHLLRNFNIIESDPEPALDAYFQQCSISITCRDLGIMAATLANAGLNPVTRDRAVVADYVENILAVMGSCGMYNYAGEWIYKIGMPAKSGVGGGILAVLPGQLGIGIFSPPLDELGNSVRGIKVCEELSHQLDLHMFRSNSNVSSVIRKYFDASAVTSNRLRHSKESSLIQKHGKCIRVYELQGPLIFSTTEVIIRELTVSGPQSRCAILDFKRSLSIDESSCELLLKAWRNFHAQNHCLLFSNSSHLTLLSRYFRVNLKETELPDFRMTEDLDYALEWAENDLLSTLAPDQVTEAAIPPEGMALMQGMENGDLKAISLLLKPRSYQKDARIIEVGEPSEEIFFLSQGAVSVVVQRPNGKDYRLATFSPGMSFGEMGVIDQAKRSAIIQADTEVKCLILSKKDFDQLDHTHPQLKIKLLKNLALEFSRNLRKANQEVLVLSE
ncbi:MAG: glutaminase A [Blastochloris sp.]|nr:glutaminase A [Blastochloris sp.]